MGSAQDLEFCEELSSVWAVRVSRAEEEKTYGFLGEINGKVGIGRNFVLVVNSGESLDLTSSSLGVDTPSVGLLAEVERSGDVDEEEVSSSSSSVLDDVGLGGFAGSFVRSDRGGNDGSSGTREFSW